MRIVALVENTTISNEYKKRHGLCLYIETNNHKILFDLGSDDTFLYNAEKLKIDISTIDAVVISHGHVDHGGAIKTFLKHNTKAQIYVQRAAFEPHFAQFLFLKINVGLDASIKSDRFVFMDEFQKIDDEISIFSGVQGQTLLPQGNKSLLKKTSQKMLLDDFTHEQNMLISENGVFTLFAGCSHKGIINIMEKATKHVDNLKYVIAGFHLFNPISRISESNDFINQIAKELLKYDVTYYTCHCTGQKAYDLAKLVLKDKLNYLSTGMEIRIEEQ